MHVELAVGEPAAQHLLVELVVEVVDRRDFPRLAAALVRVRRREERDAVLAAAR